MIDESTFDEVQDCQEIFRLLLHAASYPGEIVSIAAQAGKLAEKDKILLSLAFTLLDKETTFTVVDNDILAQTIAQLTYAKSLKEQAGLIFITKHYQSVEMNEIIAQAAPGTLTEPHLNSVLFIMVDGFVETGTVNLQGPGIKDSKPVGLTEYAIEWLNQRDRMEYEYPTGIDIFLVTLTGEIMAIPRKIKMEG